MDANQIARLGHLYAVRRQIAMTTLGRSLRRRSASARDDDQEGEGALSSCGVCRALWDNEDKRAAREIEVVEQDGAKREIGQHPLI